jgi:hypothetical protein
MGGQEHPGVCYRVMRKDEMTHDKRRRWIAGLAGAALMAVTSTAPAGTQYFQAPVQSVYPQGDGSFIVTFTQNTSLCPNQSSPQYFSVAAGQFGVNSDGVKAMLATALTAYALGKSLSFVFDDSTTNCYINRLSIQ